MSDSKYRVVFRGRITEGKTLESVKQTLAEEFQFNPGKIDKLFSGGKFVLKKDADRDSCEKLRALLEKAGAICVVEPQQPSESPPPAETAPPGNGVAEPPPVPVHPPPLPPPVLNPKPSRRNNEKFCEACGEVIKINVMACPFCGKAVSKERMGCLPKAAIAGAIGFVGLAFIGILAAIAIPNFIQYRQRAYAAGVRVELGRLMDAQAEFHANRNRYAAGLGELGFTPSSPLVTIAIQSADSDCYEARGTHQKAYREIWVDCNGFKDEMER